MAYVLPYLELDYIADLFDMERHWNNTTKRNDELSAVELGLFKQRLGFTSNNFNVTNQRGSRHRMLASFSLSLST